MIRFALLIAMLATLTADGASQQMLMRMAWASRGSSVPESYSPPGFANSVLWWKFNDGATNPIQDFSAAGINYGVAAGTQKKWADGCWSLTNAPYIGTTNTTLATGKSQYTLAIWCNLRALESFDPLLYSRASSAANNGLRVETATGGTNFTIRCYGGNSGFVTATLFTTNTWYRFVQSVSNNVGTLYVNGVSNTAGAVASLNITTPWYVSRDEFGGRFADGRFDDPIIITNYNWSASEALTDYNAGRSP